jgi:hypothetical protein
MKTSSFGFTNTSEGTATMKKISLGLLQNYAVTEDTGNAAVLSNKTAPIDQQEIIGYKSRLIPVVKNDLNVQYPSFIKGGIQYVIEDQAVLTTTDSDDPSWRVDEPIFCQLLVRHPLSGNITSNIVGEIVQRLVSAAKRDDGTWRFDDLMRSAEKPVIE